MSKGIREAPGKALIGELAAASGDRPEGAFGEPQGLKTAPECAARCPILIEAEGLVQRFTCGAAD